MYTKKEREIGGHELEHWVVNNFIGSITFCYGEKPSHNFGDPIRYCKCIMTNTNGDTVVTDKKTALSLVTLDCKYDSICACARQEVIDRVVTRIEAKKAAQKEAAEIARLRKRAEELRAQGIDI
jgi:hypothetical protein